MKQRAIAMATLGLLAGGLALAASIPAWLDTAISKWNEENPEVQIRFVDIKDSYVWYTIPDTPETGHQVIRERTHRIVEAHGYNLTNDEERVTPGRPPAPQGRSRQAKCWTRSYTRTYDTGRQSLLTTLVCAGDKAWFAGFRIID